MLGAGSLAALNFGDACFSLVNMINQDIKAKARQTILQTELLGETFEHWLEVMHGNAIESQKTALPEDKVQLMSLQETKDTFNFGIVQSILETLITKQYHDNRL